MGIVHGKCRGNLASRHKNSLVAGLVKSIVIYSVPFRPEFFVPVCKPVREYLTFHLGSDFGPFWVILDNSGQFQPRCEFRPVQDLACYLKKYIYIVKGPTTPFWTLLKNLILYSILFFDSSTLNSHLKCSLCPCAHCSLSSLSLSRDSLCLQLSQSLGLKLQPNRYSFSTPTLSD